MVEVILAVGLFVILVSGSINVVLSGFSLNRGGEEQTVANHFASEGLEAIRSIRNLNYDSLTYTAATGLTNGGGTWQLAGTNNQFGPNNKYTRTIAIEQVFRDGSGNITNSGGIADGSTKKVTSTVSWNKTPTIPNSVVLTAYIANFRRPIGGGNNFLFYGNNTTTPQTQLYDPDGDTFGGATNTVAGAIPYATDIETSPSSSTALAGYVTNAGTLYLLCFDGTTWSNEWNVNVGGTGNSRRFDIAYETASGDALVVYSTNTGTTNELALRTKAASTGCGSGNWSTPANFTANTTNGVVQWVKLAPDLRSGSNLIASLWADSNADLTSAIWDGTTFTNEPTSAHETSLEIIATTQDADAFDLAYEATSGDLMVVWANSAGQNNTNGGRYRVCTGGTAGCSWGAISTITGLSDDATNLDLAAHPNSDELVFASIGNSGSDLQAAYWNGSTWTGSANLDTSCTTPVVGSHRVATGWLALGGISRSIIVYDDQGSGNINWYLGNGAVFSKQTDYTPTPTFATNQGTLLLTPNPLNSAQILLTTADGANDLFANRLQLTAGPTLTWTESDGAIALTTNLSQNIAYPASFSFLRNP